MKPELFTSKWNLDEATTIDSGVGMAVNNWETVDF